MYSTCTYNEQENEENIKWAAETFDAEIIVPDTAEFPEIMRTEAGCRFYPHKVVGEGFFISVLRKSNDEPIRPVSKLQTKKGMKFVKYSELPFLLHEPESRFYVNDNNYVRAYPKPHFHHFLQAGKRAVV